MPAIKYKDIRFRADTLAVIAHARNIVTEYQEAGYMLTLRQLYYQFVARALIPNTMKEYKRLGGIINDARMAGLLDWDAIEDRTRNLVALSHWDTPADIIRSAAASFRVDLWEDQPTRVEVWIEKEALAGVFQRVAQQFDVAFFACRGYTSQSEMWGAAQRLRGYIKGGQECVILHFGDHDPSGLDMTRDIRERLAGFGARVDVRRLALNMDQVNTYDPPPNPAKDTDSRFIGYRDEFGDESWELDALEPQVLAGLVEDELATLVEEDRMDARKEEMALGKRLLQSTSDRWEDVVDFLEEV